MLARYWRLQQYQSPTLDEKAFASIVFLAPSFTAKVVPLVRPWPGDRSPVSTGEPLERIVVHFTRCAVD
jgi:hypothetical protein